ncbi:hypothetical protein ACLB2K_023511 [Fragaria x ananassa]
MQDVKIRFRVFLTFFLYPETSPQITVNIIDIPYSTSENSMQQKFSNFGEIAEVKLVQDEISKRSKGFAFIQYTSQDDAMLALENMDRQTLDGRVIYVELAKPGKDAYAGYPKTSGPPKKQYMQQQEEVTDCWY